MPPYIPPRMMIGMSNARIDSRKALTSSLKVDRLPPEYPRFLQMRYATSIKEPVIRNPGMNPPMNIADIEVLVATP